jgi:cold-inducible RNA-binding protein
VGYFVQPLSVDPESNRAGHLVVFQERLTVGTKIYCGNLAYSTTKAELEQLFQEYGTVQSVDVIMDRDTGQSKGFAFVEMTNSAEAQAAINGLNNQDLGGRPLKVNEAKPRESRSGGSRGGGGYGGGGGGYGGGGKSRRY